MGAQSDQETTFFNFLRNEGIHELTLHLPYDSLLEYKMKPLEFQGEIWLHYPDGDIDRMPSKYETRGRFRKKECDVPPIKINLSKSQLSKRGLTRHDKYKLVTHCNEKSRDRNVYGKEFAVYKMYEVVSDQAFAVHTLDLNYKDMHSGALIKAPGFIIESNEELSDRLDAKILDEFGFTQDSFDALFYEKLAMFHYMIGNLDQDVKIKHNCKILDRGDHYSLVPYDFDFAKIVLAPYAHPSPYSTNYLHKRQYLGAEKNAHLLPEVVSFYQSKKDDILNSVASLDALPKRDKIFFKKYIKSFYKIISRKTLLL